MMKNKRGLSSIVTTLIIILLVFISVGVIWGVVSNLLEKNKSNIEGSAICLDVGLDIKKVEELNPGKYTVTLSRTSSGTEEPVYAKVIFVNQFSEERSEVLDFSKGISPLYTLKDEISSELMGADFIEVTPYFKDESGNEFICEGKTVKSSFPPRCADVGFDFSSFNCISQQGCLGGFYRSFSGLNTHFNVSFFFEGGQGEFYVYNRTGLKKNEESCMLEGIGFLPEEGSLVYFNLLVAHPNFQSCPIIPFIPQKVKLVPYYLDGNGQKIYCQEEYTDNPIQFY